MKKQRKQKTKKTKIKKGKTYLILDSTDDFTSNSYCVVKELDEEKGEAKILIVNRRTKDDILDEGEAQRSFQPLDYVEALDDEPLTIKIKHLENLNLKGVK